MWICKSHELIFEKNTDPVILAALSIVQIASDLQQFKDYLHKDVHIPVLFLSVNAGYNQQITIKVMNDNLLLEWIHT